MSIICFKWFSFHVSNIIWQAIKICKVMWYYNGHMKNYWYRWRGVRITCFRPACLIKSNGPFTDFEDWYCAVSFCLPQNLYRRNATDWCKKWLSYCVLISFRSIGSGGICWTNYRPASGCRRALFQWSLLLGDYLCATNHMWLRNKISLIILSNMIGFLISIMRNPIK